MHGFGGWFDLDFRGTNPSTSVTLSTAPDQPTTHWYQCKLLFKEPIAVNRGQVINGKISFVANDQYSYNIQMNCIIQGTNVVATGKFNLKDQQYSYLNPETQ